MDVGCGEIAAGWVCASDLDFSGLWKRPKEQDRGMVLSPKGWEGNGVSKAPGQGQQWEPEA